MQYGCQWLSVPHLSKNFDKPQILLEKVATTVWASPTDCAVLIRLNGATASGFSGMPISVRFPFVSAVAGIHLDRGRPRSCRG